MTLRARLLAAFAYVLLLLGVALVGAVRAEPGGADRRRGGGQAAGQAQLIAASASGRLRDRAGSGGWSGARPARWRAG